MIKVRIYYPDSSRGGPHEASYTRVPCLGEIIEAPAPRAPDRSSLWEVRRVVHMRHPADAGVEAIVAVDHEGG